MPHTDSFNSAPLYCGLLAKQYDYTEYTSARKHQTHNHTILTTSAKLYLSKLWFSHDIPEMY